jgi:hypothetical protein
MSSRTRAPRSTSQVAFVHFVGSVPRLHPPRSPWSVAASRHRSPPEPDSISLCGLPWRSPLTRRTTRTSPHPDRRLQCGGLGGGHAVHVPWRRTRRRRAVRGRECRTGFVDLARPAPGGVPLGRRGHQVRIGDQLRRALYHDVVPLRRERDRTPRVTLEVSALACGTAGHDPVRAVVPSRPDTGDVRAAVGIGRGEPGRVPARPAVSVPVLPFGQRIPRRRPSRGARGSVSRRPGAVRLPIQRRQHGEPVRPSCGRQPRRRPIVRPDNRWRDDGDGG